MTAEHEVKKFVFSLIQRKTHERAVLEVDGFGDESLPLFCDLSFCMILSALIEVAEVEFTLFFYLLKYIFTISADDGAPGIVACDDPSYSLFHGIYLKWPFDPACERDVIHRTIRIDQAVHPDASLYH